jgi:hypothetical protein
MIFEESIELWNKLRANLDPKYKLGAPLMLKYTAGESGALGTAESAVWYVSDYISSVLQSWDWERGLTLIRITFSTRAKSSSISFLSNS